MSESTFAFAASGLSRGLGHPVIAALWLALSCAGAVALLRAARGRQVVLGSLLPLTLVVYGLSNPAHARYFVPILALTCGLVVLGAALVLRHLTAPAVALAVLGAGLAVIPELPGYRSEVSPPLRAIRRAVAEAERTRGVIIADRTLIAFVDYEKLSGRQGQTLIFDFVIEQGSSPPPPADLTIAVFDRDHGGLVLASERTVVHRTAIPLVRRLSQDRFLEVTVASGARLVNRKPGGGPFIVM